MFCHYVKNYLLLKLQEFVKAVVAYQKKVNGCTKNTKNGLKMDKELDKRRKMIVRSFSMAKNMYACKHHDYDAAGFKEQELEVGAEFLEVNLTTYKNLFNYENFLGD